jgi:hypothetical protein
LPDGDREGEKAADAALGLLESGEWLSASCSPACGGLKMIACTLSNLELRGIIESAFLPLRCNCTVMEDVMTMEVIDPATERVELVASNIALDTLDNSHALCVLIRELQAELEKTRH